MPLIVTLSLASPIQERFEALRRQWFPSGRNQVPAHITLFHALPDDEAEAARAIAQTGRTGFDLDITGLRLLGRGVAYTIAAPELNARRGAVARHFAGRLTRQDSAPFRPHITVQNKVEPDEARSLHAQLSAGFTPQRVRAAAIHLWRYLDGPWEELLTLDLHD